MVFDFAARTLSGTVLQQRMQYAGTDTSFAVLPGALVGFCTGDSATECVRGGESAVRAAAGTKLCYLRTASSVPGSHRVL